MIKVIPGTGGSRMKLHILRCQGTGAAFGQKLICPLVFRIAVSISLGSKYPATRALAEEFIQVDGAPLQVGF